jgi:hypothetical protein
LTTAAPPTGFVAATFATPAATAAAPAASSATASATPFTPLPATLIAFGAGSLGTLLRELRSGLLVLLRGTMSAATATPTTATLGLLAMTATPLLAMLTTSLGMLAVTALLGTMALLLAVAASLLLAMTAALLLVGHRGAVSDLALLLRAALVAAGGLFRGQFHGEAFGQ